MKQKLVKFNIKNVKYAEKTAPLTYSAPNDLAYAQAISLESDYNETNIYGDGQIIGKLADDKGKTGTLTVMDINEEFEIAAGRMMAAQDTGGIGEEMRAEIQQLDSKEFAIYFEVEALVDGTIETHKVWLYNVVTGKPNETYQQTEDDPTINPYEYPLTVLGEYLQASGGGSDYENANGNKVKVWKTVVNPADTNYATFGDAVPTPEATV